MSHATLRALALRAPLLLVLLGAGCTMEASAQPPQDEGAQGVAEPAGVPGAVAAQVNGVAIPEEAVETRILAVLSERFRGSVPEGLDLEQLRRMLRQQVLEALIDEELLDQDAARAEVAVSEDDCRADLAQRVAGYLLHADLTQAEFEQQVQEVEGLSFAEFCDRRAQDAEFRRVVRHEHLVQLRYPDKVAVTEEEVAQRYARDRESVYSRLARVRASHILIATDGALSEEAKAAARQKAEDVRAKAVAPGADFAALAREFSTCPSSARGGDLDFFPREGAMVEPFAAAAFALPVGGTSEVVETDFGFHVIRVTERKEARQVSLEEATPVLRVELLAEKTSAAREELVAALREGAKIVYPGEPEQG